MDIGDFLNLAQSHMNKFGLDTWQLEIDRAVRRAGLCNYSHRVISLSHHYITRNVWDGVVEDTVLHEIAHALVGPGHGHNSIWKRKCIEVGARPERCYDSSQVDMPERRYIGMCPSCNLTIRRFRRRQLVCNKCREYIVWEEVPF